MAEGSYVPGGRTPLAGAGESNARDAVDELAPWIAPLARLGYVAKGLVYILVGLLAAQAAAGTGDGGAPGSRDALRTVLEQPFGRVALGIMAAGLFGYAIWRLVSAATDAEHRGSSSKGLAIRTGHALSGVAYASLGVAAAQLLLGGRTSGDGEQTRTWIRRVLDWPAGEWVVAAAGAYVAGYGIYQLWRAWKGKVRKHLDLHTLSAEQQVWVVRLGRFGLAARGVVFVMLGWLALRAGLARSPERAGGLADALRAVEGAGGARFLAIVAVGLAAYGVYQLISARYRRIAVA